MNEPKKPFSLEPVPEHVERYAVRLVMATQPGTVRAPESVERNVLLGASPRGAQGLVLAGKVRALLDGRFAVGNQDIAAAAPDVLRHRVLVNYRGLAEAVTPDDLIADVLSAVAVPEDR